MENKKGFSNLIINVLIPTIILTRFSSEEYLGVKGGLVAALSFPICYGSYEFIKEKKVNFLSLLGLVSVLLTGVIGLIELEGKWIAVKEAAIPLLIGIFVFFSRKTKFAIVTNLLKTVMNFDLIKEKFIEKNELALLEEKLERTHIFLALNFLLSTVLNYGLAIYLVTAPSGTEEFNNQIGKMTALSFPVIGIPTGIGLTCIIFWLFKSIKEVTGLELEEVILKN